MSRVQSPPHPLMQRWLLAVLLLGCTAGCARGGEPSDDRADRGAASANVAAAAPTLAAPPAEPAVPSAAPRSNWLENPGFEAGRAGWESMGGREWGAFEVVDGPAHGGERAARLQVRGWPGESQSVRVFGVVQEPTPDEFPERLAGWYRVESWEAPPPPTKTYVQVVVIVWGDPRTQELVTPGRTSPKITNYQIRYYLSGVDEPPFRLANARYKFLGRGQPELGRWVRFETDVRRDFEELWGVVPEDYEFVRVLFEGRFDQRPPDVAVSADVLYDDLVFGTPSAAPSTGAALR